MLCLPCGSTCRLFQQLMLGNSPVLWNLAHATAVADDEVLTSVRIPATSAARAGTAVVEIARRHGDFALVGVACVVRFDDADTISRRPSRCSASRRRRCA